jgi:hypothetical protein
MDIDKWGYRDARLKRGSMTEQQIADWTSAIHCDEDEVQKGRTGCRP